MVVLQLSLFIFPLCYACEICDSVNKVGNGIDAS